MDPLSDAGKTRRPGDLGSPPMKEAESLSDYVYRVLKNEILLCRLAPGAEISEAQLAERYGFSKAPLRSALTRLRQEKLVMTRGRLGNIVAPITVQDVHEVFQLRLLLEVEATRLAAGRIEPERLKRLDKRVRECHAARGHATSEAYREANLEFHRYIVEASGNSRLAEMVIALIEQHERIVHFSLTLHKRDNEFHHVHDNLVEALLAGEGTRAAEIAQKAIRGSQDKVIGSFASNASQLYLSPAPSAESREN